MSCFGTHRLLPPKSVYIVVCTRRRIIDIGKVHLHRQRHILHMINGCVRMPKASSIASWRTLANIHINLTLPETRIYGEHLFRR